MRRGWVWIALGVAATLGAPWLTGGWAVGRMVALVLAPGAAVLLLGAPALLAPPVAALAAALLASAVLAPASLFGLAALCGGLDRAWPFYALLWSVLLIAGALRARRHGGGLCFDRTAREDLAWLAGGVLVIGLPMLLNPSLHTKSDAWTHVALVRTILGQPYPWDDPRFAGQPLRYFWFFNYWAAGFAARGGCSIPWSLALMNLTALAAFAAALLALVRRLLAHSAGRGAALAVTLTACNPLGVFLIAVQLSRALGGRRQGLAFFQQLLGDLHFFDSRVRETITPYGSSPVAWLNKFFVITPYGFGMAAALLASLIVWEAARARRVTASAWWLLALTYAAAALHHTVAAVSLGGALGGALVVAWLARRSPFGLRATGTLLGALAAGALAAAPYYAGILGGREHDGGAGGYGLGIDPLWVRTTLTCLGPMFLMLWLGRRRLRETLGAAAPLFGALAALSLLMTLVVRMPTVNENKLLMMVCCLLAPFAVFGVQRVQTAARRRRATRAAWSVFVAGAALVPALLWFGYLLDPPEASPADPIAAAKWLRTQTPADAVLVEPVEAQFLLNRAERDLWVSKPNFISECGYPRETLGRRLALVDSLYATGRLTSDQVRELRDLGRPVYLFFARYAPGDDRLDRIGRPALRDFERLFARGEAEVYRLRETPLP